MSTLLFANNAQTTLAGPIASGALSVNVAAGTGSEFPAPTAGQYFVLTLTDAATGLIHEIVWVTARSGDTLTVQRAQEGTSARSWLAGDVAGNWWTAGSAATMVQVQALQVQAGNYAVDSGSTNSIQIALNPTPASLATIAGAPIRVLVAHANTGATTLTIASLASTAVFPQSGSTPLPAGAVTAGQVYEFTYVAGLGFEVSTPKVLLSTQNLWTQFQTTANNVPWASNNTSGIPQSLITTNSSNNAMLFAGPSGSTAWQVANNAGTQVLMYLGATGALHAVGGITADTGNVTVTSGRLRASLGALGSGDGNAATLLGDFQNSASISGSVNSYFYQQFPSGLIIQGWGGTSATGNSDAVTFPNPFPTGCIQVILTEGNPSGWFSSGGGSVGNAATTIFGAQQLTATGFQLYVCAWDIVNKLWKNNGGVAYRFIAVGF
jgi:hypothetical protein